MILILLTVTVILFILAYTVTISIDSPAYFSYISKSNYKLSNRRLAELMNGNVLSNLPNLVVSSKNPTVCTTSFTIFLTKLPDYLVPMEDLELHNEATDSQFDVGCEKICPHLSLQPLIIRDREKQEIFADGKQLHEGVWCVRRRPRCNPRTTFTLMTANGDAICRSKFPNFFGGLEGNKIVACNNSLHFHPKNVLLDYSVSPPVPVDPRSVVMSHEDELLDSGNLDSYRFRCSFNGTDHLGNKFIQHPLNRLHPMRNPCLLEIPNASRYYNFNAKTGTCECKGEGSDVGNRIPGDLKTPCTSCRTFWEQNKLTVKEPCFVKSDVYTEARTKLPCLTEKLQKDAATCMAIENLDMVAYRPEQKGLDVSRIPLPLFPGDAKGSSSYVHGAWIVYSWAELKWTGMMDPN